MVVSTVGDDKAVVVVVVASHRGGAERSAMTRRRWSWLPVVRCCLWKPVVHFGDRVYDSGTVVCGPRRPGVSDRWIMVVPVDHDCTMGCEVLWRRQSEAAQF